ncbi:hypothetical protein FXN63_17310 [Pigmentiphaga aceris]|uniref:Cellulose biosynthesis protein BcsR n=1 Tax=Pigmentiphaga aceris TaxID=1940612 RepID=A0A5C0B0J8_9BURK|nr:cellulose biosynthesis protein BcsP [Pigmentiphaga aceris]QEI07404.1 hypothetical protein FXN63_17310 [Pigmentiphaga aceris]
MKTTTESDIPELFRQFSGNSANYQELTRAAAARASQARWPLLSAVELEQGDIPAVIDRETGRTVLETAPTKPDAALAEPVVSVVPAVPAVAAEPEFAVLTEVIPEAPPTTGEILALASDDGVTLTNDEILALTDIDAPPAAPEPITVPGTNTIFMAPAPFSARHFAQVERALAARREAALNELAAEPERAEDVVAGDVGTVEAAADTLATGEAMADEPIVLKPQFVAPLIETPPAVAADAELPPFALAAPVEAPAETPVAAVSPVVTPVVIPVVIPAVIPAATPAITPTAPVTAAPIAETPVKSSPLKPLTLRPAVARTPVADTPAIHTPAASNPVFASPAPVVPASLFTPAAVAPAPVPLAPIAAPAPVATPPLATRPALPRKTMPAIPSTPAQAVQAAPSTPAPTVPVAAPQTAPADGEAAVKHAGLKPLFDRLAAPEETTTPVMSLFTRLLKS